MRKRILLGASLPEGGPPGTDGWGRRGRRGEEEEGGERTAEGRGEEEGGGRERKCSFGVYMCITIMYFLKDELLLYRFVFVVFLYKNPEAIYCMHCIMLKSAVCACMGPTAVRCYLHWGGVCGQRLLLGRCFSWLLLCAALCT